MRLSALARDRGNRPTARLLVAALGFTLLVGAGCDALGAEDADPGSSAVGDSSASSDPTPAPSSSAAAPVAPATGHRVALKHFSVRVPAGLDVADQMIGGIWQADRADRPLGIDTFSIGEWPSLFGYVNVHDSIAEESKTALRTYGKVQRYPDVEIDGNKMWHISAKIVDGLGKGGWYEAMGMMLHGRGDDRAWYSVHLSWTMPGHLNARERTRRLQSVLATWKWKGEH